MKNKKIAYLLIILLFFLFAFGIILEKKGRNCPSSASTKYKTDDDKTKEDEKNVTEIKDRQGRAVILIAKGVSLNKQNEKNAPKKKDRSGKANKNNNSEAIENSNSGVNNNSEVIKDSNSGVNENNSSELTVSKEIEVNKGKEKKEAEDFDPRGKEKIETGEETTAHVHCYIPVTRSVFVAEKGHWLTNVTEEWDEYIYEWHEYCSVCDMDLTQNYGGANTEGAFLHRLSHGSDMNYYAKESDQIKETIHHDKEVTEYYVVDEEAHEEELIDHYECSCGKIKYED